MLKKAKEKIYDDFYSWQGAEQYGSAWVRVTEFDKQHPDWPALKSDYDRIYCLIESFWGLADHPSTYNFNQQCDSRHWERIYPYPDSFRSANILVAIGYGPSYSGRFFYVPFLFSAILGHQIGITPRMCAVSLGHTISKMLRVLPLPGQGRDSQRVIDTGVILGDLEGDKTQAEWLEVVLSVSRDIFDVKVEWPL